MASLWGITRREEEREAGGGGREVRERERGGYKRLRYISEERDREI